MRLAIGLAASMLVAVQTRGVFTGTRFDRYVFVGVSMSWVARLGVVLFGAALAVSVLGSGVASADPLAGDTYADAAEKISGWGATPVIYSVVGTGLPTDECIVTSSQQSNFLNSSGTNSRSGEFLVNLNCNRKVASAGHPGNSAMSPEGRAAKKDETNALYVEKHPDVCEKSDGAMTWCENLCKRTGLCTVGQ